MRIFERDFLLHRIISGYINIKFNELKLKYFTAPSLDILYQASEVYYNTYYEAKDNGLMDDKEIQIFLVEQGVWNDEDEEHLEKKIPEYIENIKIEMYRNFRKPEFLHTSRKYIKKANEKFNDLFALRHSWDHLTCHGTASYARWQFIIENCTYYGSQLMELSSSGIADVLEQVNLARIDETMIREISRSEPWRTTWFNGKRCQLFSRPAVEFSDEQKRLVHWSMMYDNIYENSDCPPDEVVEDDDCLDGWMLLKKQERVKEKTKNYLEEKIGKNMNAGEVFVVVDNEKEANDVSELNDMLGKSIINQRLASIKQHGTRRDDQFFDVKQELQMKMNNAEKNAMKGR